MTTIWFCRDCGYEVPSRGRCHNCRARLERSPLPELAAAEEEDEVGYRLDGWTPSARGRLIVGLIDAGILHRFEEEDLVVLADDEERADDLVAEATLPVDGDEEDQAGEDGYAGEEEEEDEQLVADVGLLYRAAERLRVDPTDMHADGDVAQASAVVFTVERFARADPDTWAAVGRVTRRLLAALGADEALEDEIRLQAGVLVKLLEPLVAPDVGFLLGDEDGADAGAPVAGALDEAGAPVAGALGDDAAALVDDAGAAPPAEHTVPAAGSAVAGTEDTAAGQDTAASQDTAGEDDVDDWELGDEDDIDEDDIDEEEAEEVERHAARGESVYELPEWLPEQRAELSLLLDEAKVDHAWDGGDLVVPAALEETVEALFDRIEGVRAAEDDGERYRALEELFAAADRFVNDPDNKAKAAEVVRSVSAADGPTPLGLDDAQWWAIRTRARTLADAIDHDANLEVIFGEATTLRDLLRPIL